MRKSLSIFLLVLAFVTVLSGCSKEETITSDEMPYGATMVDDKTGYKVPILYDKRFLTDEQIKVITDFYYAIQANDKDLFSEVMIPGFNEYSEKYNGTGMDESLEMFHSNMISNYGEDFEFSSVEITEMTSEKIVSGINTMLERMDLVEEGSSDKVSESYELKSNLLVRYGESSAYIENDILYLMKIDDRYYIIM